VTSLKGCEALQALYPDARILTDGGVTYIHLPKLKIEANGSTAEMEALLCAQQHGGYTTRLFLAQPIAGKGANWTTHGILGRQWHTWSWNNISADLPVLEILTNHLRALR